MQGDSQKLLLTTKPEPPCTKPTMEDLEV